MRFLETSVFTRAVVEFMEDEAYRALQLALLLRPQLGSAIRGSGDLRKLRWSLKSKGKRGGVRVIYYWDEASETFYMLFIYRKSTQEDLTAQQRKILTRLVRKEFG